MLSNLPFRGLATCIGWLETRRRFHVSVPNNLLNFCTGGMVMLAVLLRSSTCTKGPWVTYGCGNQIDKNILTHRFACVRLLSKRNLDGPRKLWGRWRHQAPLASHCWEMYVGFGLAKTKPSSSLSLRMKKSSNWTWPSSRSSNTRVHVFQKRCWTMKVASNAFKKLNWETYFRTKFGNGSSHSLQVLEHYIATVAHGM